MAILEYGTKQQLDANHHLGTIITPQDLNALLDSIQPPPADGIYVVADTDGDTSISGSASIASRPVDVVLVNDQLVTSNALDALTPNASGGFDNIDAYKTVVTATGRPLVVDAIKSAYVELLGGGATVDGGMAHTFVADASHDGSAVALNASNADGSYSWLVGGSGNDTLTGSMSSTGKAVLGAPSGADSGATSMYGGAGAATMYGGGHTTMVAGDHAGQFLPGQSIASTVSGAGQALYDYTYNAHDSLVAGSGGYNLLSVAFGNQSVLDDRHGNGTDHVFAGGSDTVYGSAHGTSITLQGFDSVLSAGSDTISVGQGGFHDTITAGAAVDTVTFQGYTAAEVKGLVDTQVAATHSNNVTIQFTNAGVPNGQTATLNNVTNIHFLDGK
jgi:hypothetical protein